MDQDANTAHRTMNPPPRALRRFALLVVLTAQCALAAAQNFGFDAPPDADDTALTEALRDLAMRVVPVYMDDDSDRYLLTLAALQMAVGDPPAANTTRASLRERLASEQREPPTGRAFVYDIYTHARAIETTDGVPFATAYEQAFRAALSSLDDLEAFELERWFVTPVEPLRETLQRALDEQTGKSSITLEKALELVRAWFSFDAYRHFAGLVRPLLAEDSDRRYLTENVAIHVENDATIAAVLVRPRQATAAGPLPTVLEFTLDASSRDAREAAAHGYASVLAVARIAGDPRYRPRGPFESDGDDARAAIRWIADQSWSGGRVAMQGVGYGGFVGWSAAKEAPERLRAIATVDPMAPGIDVPSRNRIVLNSAYHWVYDLLAPPGDAIAADDARWRSLDEDWYRSGRVYREFPALPGRASAVFRRWLNHPTFDSFWRERLPLADELSRIDIPVLTMSGYYSTGATGASYFFTEHRRQNPQADHALLIGPFDARGAEQGAGAFVRELAVDPEARIDPSAVRYAWLDYALRNGERPAVLAAAVNYELAGANGWRHAASLEDLEAQPLRLYLAAAANAEPPYALAPEKSPEPMSLTQTMDMRDRSDAEWRPSRALVLRELDPRDGLLFVTEPFAEGLDVAGRFRGELDFTINKQDVDLALSLYELRTNGEYVKLFDPAFVFRASYARDRTRRRLLAAGIRQQLPLQSERLFARRLEPGSRLALTVAINKRADQQINYGAGGEVSEESIEDAGAPVRIRWHEGSYIELAMQ